MRIVNFLSVTTGVLWLGISLQHVTSSPFNHAPLHLEATVSSAVPSNKSHIAEEPKLTLFGRSDDTNGPHTEHNNLFHHNSISIETNRDNSHEPLHYLNSTVGVHAINAAASDSSLGQISTSFGDRINSKSSKQRKWRENRYIDAHGLGTDPVSIVDSLVDSTPMYNLSLGYTMSRSSNREVPSNSPVIGCPALCQVEDDCTQLGYNCVDNCCRKIRIDSSKSVKPTSSQSPIRFRKDTSNSPTRGPSVFKSSRQPSTGSKSSKPTSSSQSTAIPVLPGEERTRKPTGSSQPTLPGQSTTSPVLAGGETAKKPTGKPSSRQPSSSKSYKPSSPDKSTASPVYSGRETTKKPTETLLSRQPSSLKSPMPASSGQSTKSPVLAGGDTTNKTTGEPSSRQTSSSKSSKPTSPDRVITGKPSSGQPSSSKSSKPTSLGQSSSVSSKMNCIQDASLLISNQLFNFVQSPITPGGEITRKPTGKPFTGQPSSSKSSKPTSPGESTANPINSGGEITRKPTGEPSSGQPPSSKSSKPTSPGQSSSSPINSGGEITRKPTLGPFSREPSSSKSSKPTSPGEPTASPINSGGEVTRKPTGKPSSRQPSSSKSSKPTSPGELTANPINSGGEITRKPTLGPFSRQPSSSKSSKPTAPSESTANPINSGGEITRKPTLGPFSRQPSSSKSSKPTAPSESTAVSSKNGLSQCLQPAYLSPTFQLSLEPNKFRWRNNKKANSWTFFKTALQFEVIEAYSPWSIYTSGEATMIPTQGPFGSKSSKQPSTSSKTSKPTGSTKSPSQIGEESSSVPTQAPSRIDNPGYPSKSPTEQTDITFRPSRSPIRSGGETETLKPSHCIEPSYKFCQNGHWDCNACKCVCDAGWCHSEDGTCTVRCSGEPTQDPGGTNPTIEPTPRSPAPTNSMETTIPTNSPTTNPTIVPSKLWPPSTGPSETRTKSPSTVVSPNPTHCREPYSGFCQNGHWDCNACKCICDPGWCRCSDGTCTVSCSGAPTMKPIITHPPTLPPKTPKKPPLPEHTPHPPPPPPPPPHPHFLPPKLLSNSPSMKQTLPSENPSASPSFSSAPSKSERSPAPTKAPVNVGGETDMPTGKAATFPPSTVPTTSPSASPSKNLIQNPLEEQMQMNLLANFSRNVNDMKLIGVYNDPVKDITQGFGATITVSYAIEFMSTEMTIVDGTGIRNAELHGSILLKIPIEEIGTTYIQEVWEEDHFSYTVLMDLKKQLNVTSQESPNSGGSEGNIAHSTCS
eukprot:CCRYP_000391-RB/>CCRYP_000391-RB protein AED:0.12 eAED:0.11 QI:330/0.66/0.62/1/0.66/0.68/16/0/1252